MADALLPEISVVVPTCNRAGCLENCLRALAAQSLDPELFEVIVVDDGSRDKTGEVCARLATRYPHFRTHHQENRGPAAARNAGIRLATAPIVAFTDDDCEPPPDWLARIRNAFQASPSLIALGGVMITHPGDWVPLTHHSDLTAPGGTDYSKFIGTNNAAYKRDVLLTLGGFDETFRHVSVEDAELFLRVRQEGPTLIDPNLFVLHPARRTGFNEAVRAYVRFYRGYQALERRYPKEFLEIYGGSPERAVLKGRSWGRRIRTYLPGMVKHPWRGVRFLMYLAVSRAIVTGMYVTERRRP